MTILEYSAGKCPAVRTATFGLAALLLSSCTTTNNAVTGGSEEQSAVNTFEELCYANTPDFEHGVGRAVHNALVEGKPEFEEGARGIRWRGNWRDRQIEVTVSETHYTNGDMHSCSVDFGRMDENALSDLLVNEFKLRGGPETENPTSFKWTGSTTGYETKVWLYQVAHIGPRADHIVVALSVQLKPDENLP